ncbi:MAG: amidase [Chloroflexota bacterium]|nr:amidase [Chloroflexota bacterium]|tara:strand:+ start:173 stop:1591 length:1419 start_codon:yes stop_codon:yes gene_type:complete
MSSLANLSVSEISDLIFKKELSPVDLFSFYSERINKLDSKINSFIEIFDNWEEKAKISEQEISRGEYKGPLHGIPVAVKDLVDVKSKITTAGSKILSSNIAKSSAEIVNALESSGAIIIGKTELVEFAFGPHGINSNSKQTKNPWDLNKIPGGSSSGSAAAVSADLVPIAIGSDTGGSIRMPASFCGVTGFKPSYNKLSTKGVFPLSWTLDTVGPLGKNSKDCSIFVEEVCKNQNPDDQDPYRGFSTSMLDNFDSLLPVRLRIGIPNDDYFSEMDDEVRKVFNDSVELMKSNGAEIINVDLSWLSIARPVNVVITLAEAISVHKDYLISNYEDYTYEVISRLVSGEGLSINDYLSSLRVMSYIQRKMNDEFNNFDILACPTTPELPGLIEEYSKENLSASKEVVGGRIPSFTSIFNVTRQPSLSTLAGFSSTGMPVGLMFTGRFNKDFGVLQVGNWFEKINYNNRIEKPTIE